jgi:GDP-L-fucose synthase
MKILVTGSSGLVGDAVCKRLEKEHKGADFYFLTSRLCDLRDYQQVDHVFSAFLPDTVIHLASLVGGLYGNLDNNYTFLTDNLKINMNVLEACKRYHVKKLINILSTCIFPDQGVSYPLTSDQIVNGAPHYSNEGYAYSKRMLYVGSNLLLKTDQKINIVNLIPTNLYGNNDNYHLQKSHVIPGLIHKCYLAKMSGGDFFIKGSGMASRQFLHVDDFADVISRFVTFNGNATLIVSPPKESEIKIRELVDLIADSFEFKGKIVYESDFADGQIKKTTDSVELLNYFPDFTFTTIQDGLKTNIDYFIQNYERVRK